MSTFTQILGGFHGFRKTPWSRIGTLWIKIHLVILLVTFFVGWKRDPNSKVRTGEEVAVWGSTWAFSQLGLGVNESNPVDKIAGGPLAVINGSSFFSPISRVNVHPVIHWFSAIVEGFNSVYNDRRGEDQVGPNQKLALVFERSCFLFFWDSKAPDRIMTTKIFMKKFHPLKNTYGIHDGSQGFPEIPWWDTSCYGLAGGPKQFVMVEWNGALFKK